MAAAMAVVVEVAASVEVATVATGVRTAVEDFEASAPSTSG